jgi:hypothetical protein
MHAMALLTIQSVPLTRTTHTLITNKQQHQTTKLHITAQNKHNDNQKEKKKVRKGKESETPSNYFVNADTIT